jgi:hypothetical protein
MIEKKKSEVHIYFFSKKKQKKIEYKNFEEKKN